MKKIKIFAMDVDGTLTDGKIYMGLSGEVCKTFNIKDGYGIHDLLRSTNIEPVIITGRVSQIVQNRCRELGIETVHQGVLDKTEKLKEIMNALETAVSEVAYMGDDLNDLDCMRYIKAGGGIVGCPSDAAFEIKNVADFISTRGGGDGAVREFIEWILHM